MHGPDPHTTHRATLIAFLALWAIPRILPAQPQAELKQAFLDLSHDGVIMNISAHPDDEDGATLAYYGMKWGVKTYSVFFTRGEGGQNEKGPELYEELGVLRTAETQAASKLQGTSVRFLNFPDFGFSKTATETFRRWGGHREVLRRLVYTIRLLKPDILFTHHNTIDGHGHHQAVGIIAVEAFDAAADSSFFPEQLREPGVTLWQPRKLFVRNFSRTDPTADVVTGIEEVNPDRGMSYFDIAIEALKMHKTQGGDRIDLRRFTRGQSIYRLVRENSLYDRDTTTFFGGVALAADESMRDLAGIRTRISALRPDMSRTSLLRDISLLLAQIRAKHPAPSPLADRLLTQWRQKLENLGALVSGLGVRFTLRDPVLVPKQKVRGALVVFADPHRIGNVRDEITLPAGWSLQEEPWVEKGDGTFTRNFTLTVPAGAHLTLPKAIAQYNPIEWDQSIPIHLTFDADGNRLSLTKEQFIDVAPPEVLTISPKITRITEKGRTFEFTVKNFLPHKTAGKITVVAPPGWTGGTARFVVAGEDSQANGSIQVRPPKGLRRGEYHLGFRTELASAEATVKSFDVAVAPSLTLGIVESYDNTLEVAADVLGVPYELLDERDLESGDLGKYSTVIVDIRAYLVREDLKANNARLLDYVRSGGNLVVMYQRNQEWKPEYAPYPLEITTRRVTDEEAPVTILQPGHALFNVPNRITGEDWHGWKQERAVYIPAGVTPGYVQLLSSHDPDEQPLTTGYLVAPFGKGSYIYTSYVWYRQLKEMNPGAFRCLANMVSYRSKP